MTGILLADDHPLFREALHSTVHRALPDNPIFEANTLAEAKQILSRENIALLLLDLKMSDCDGFTGLLEIRGEYPRLPVLIVSATDDSDAISRSLAFGASGFVSKGTASADVVAGINAVLAGDVWAPAVRYAKVSDSINSIASLTPAQLRIFLCIRRGLVNKQISHQMSITEATVRAHLTTIFRKLGVQNRTQAVIAAQNIALDVSSNSSKTT